MISEKKLTVIGSINLDLIASASSDFFNTVGSDLQEWTNWETQVGGTAANLAIASAEAGIDTRLLGVTGDDWAGELVSKMLAQKDLSLHFTRLVDNDAATAIVLLLYTNMQYGNSYRKVLGPDISAVDKINLNLITEEFCDLYSNDIVLIDGYFLRKRASELHDLLNFFSDKECRTALELVPHKIWEEIDSDVLVNLLKRIDYVSSELSTIERIFDIIPDCLVSTQERVSRLSIKIQETITDTVFHLRTGKRGFSEVAICNSSDSYKLIKYDINSFDDTQKSIGDYLFIMEMFGLNEKHITNSKIFHYKNEIAAPLQLEQ